MPLRSVLLFATLAFAAPALGQEGGRALCPDRPGLGTPACTLDAGATMLEIGIADWTLDRNADSRTDGLAFGDALLRVGLTPSLEAQIGWTMLGHVRERDRTTGDVARWTRTGDVTLALRQNLRNPDGSGFSAALMPYATLPVGGRGVGAGDWGAGLIVPVSFELGAVSLGVSPHVDAAVDADGDGRHLAYGSVVGLGFGVSDDVSAAAEVSLTRDRDPDGRTTEALAGLSAGWQPGPDSQWDVGANLGLNRASPDIELYLGFAHRF
ncbi:transporter [Sphingopyxis sp.]|uniref:transporter n=1 Tax=Sphingopyxis sp. TaxID=1908224 RepID=UPI002D776749|nr:transporter [Sphingopyxis sp.]HET6526587.1 transporter [Sphingopyxis sp.]